MFYNALSYFPNDCPQISICDHVLLPTLMSYTPALFYLLHPTLFLTVTRLKSASHPWRLLGGHCFKYMFHGAFVRATGAEPVPLEIKNENFAVRQT